MSVVYVPGVLQEKLDPMLRHGHFVMKELILHATCHPSIASFGNIQEPALV